MTYHPAPNDSSAEEHPFNPDEQPTQRVNRSPNEQPTEQTRPSPRRKAPIHPAIRPVPSIPSSRAVIPFRLKPTHHPERRSHLQPRPKLGPPTLRPMATSQGNRRLAGQGFGAS